MCLKALYVFVLFKEKNQSLTCINPHYMSRLMTKPTKWHVCPAKAQSSLGIRPVWSESSLSAWRKLGSLATHWRTAKTLIRLGAHIILLVLSWGGSIMYMKAKCGFMLIRLLPSIKNTSLVDVLLYINRFCKKKLFQLCMIDYRKNSSYKIFM